MLKNLSLLLFASVLMFNGCNSPVNPEDPDQKGSVQFSFGQSSSNAKQLSKINSSSAKAVLVTVVNSSGATVFQLKKFDLVTFGSTYITQPIELPVGNYTITDFVVIDENNEALYATPKIDSPLATVVTHPLPVSLNIQKDNVTNLTLEVIEIDNSAPEDFGYVSFKFDIIETIRFLIAVSVFDDKTNGFVLTEATLNVNYLEISLYSNTISALTNSIIIRDSGNSSEYILSISKPGYQTVEKSLTHDHLKTYSASPIVITMTKGGSTENDYMLAYTSNYESYFLKPDGSELTKFADLAFPVWVNNKQSVAFLTSSSINVYNFGSLSLEKSIVLKGSSGFYLWYSPSINKFTYTINSSPYLKIGVADQEGNVTVIDRGFTIASPATSGVDDWIYYANAADGTNDIHRMKSDGSQDEPMTKESTAYYGNFGVSYDGAYVVAPKIKGSVSYISVINTITKAETLHDVTHIGQLIGYTTISKNNQYIYFTATTNRNLYKMNFDGSGIIQLTSGVTMHRPMTW